MIATTVTKVGKFLQLVRKGIACTQAGCVTGEPEGAEAWEPVLIAPHSRLLAGGASQFRSQPIHSVMSVFSSLPNATTVIAAKDPDYVSLGVGTEIIARATKGGINVKTQSTSPATADDAMITTVANDGSIVPLRAAAQGLFACRVNLTQVTLQLFFAGFNQTFTAVDPTASAGEGIGFVFDPTNALTSGVATYATNWLAYQKVNGVDVYSDTGVPVLAGIDVDLRCQYGSDLTPSYYINGNQVAVGFGSAATADATVAPLVGVKIVDVGTPVQHDFDLRYLTSERQIG